MIGFVVGVIAGGICVHVTWLIFWLAYMSRFSADIKAANRREDELEARIKRETSDDWWKGEANEV